MFKTNQNKRFKFTFDLPVPRGRCFVLFYFYTFYRQQEKEKYKGIFQTQKVFKARSIWYSGGGAWDLCLGRNFFFW